VNGLVDQKLRDLAKKMKEFEGGEEKNSETHDFPPLDKVE